MHELFKYVVRGKWRVVAEGKCICSCKRSRTARSSMKMGWYHMFSEAGTERFVFRARSGLLCPAESSKIQLCGHGKKAEKTDWDGVCSGVWCVRNKTSYISWTMRAKASFFHDNQVPHPKYQCFCAVMSVRLRKARANEVPLCFRCAASLRAHPNIYHQRSAPSRIHWQVNVKGVVSCPPWMCNHDEILSENPSSCTDLKDPRSGVDYSCWRWVPLKVHMHINPGLLDCEDTTPLLLPIFRRPLRRLFVVPTLGGNFSRTWKRMDGLHTLFKK